jgi:hypothetical protein
MHLVAPWLIEPKVTGWRRRFRQAHRRAAACYTSAKSVTHPVLRPARPPRRRRRRPAFPCPPTGGRFRIGAV